MARPLVVINHHLPGTSSITDHARPMPDSARPAAGEARWGRSPHPTVEVTTSQLRIELMFPADAEAEAFFRNRMPVTG